MVRPEAPPVGAGLRPRGFAARPSALPTMSD